MNTTNPSAIISKGLSKSFPVAGEILKPISLTIHTGQWVALVGPSGSGKSTLLSILAGLETPTAGELLWFNQPVHTLNDDERALLRRKHLGFVFQNFQLIPDFTVLENVSLPLELLKDPAASEKAEALLVKLGLGNRLQFYPQVLSGGEQQRVALARAMIHEPTLFFADEPTGNLDSKNAALFLEQLELLRQERPQMTGIVVTHDHQLAKRLCSFSKGNETPTTENSARWLEIQDGVCRWVD